MTAQLRYFSLFVFFFPTLQVAADVNFLEGGGM